MGLGIWSGDDWNPYCRRRNGVPVGLWVDMTVIKLTSGEFQTTPQRQEKNQKDKRVLSIKRTYVIARDSSIKFYSASSTTTPLFLMKQYLYMHRAETACTHAHTHA